VVEMLLALSDNLDGRVPHKSLGESSHFVGTALFSAHVASRPVSLPKIDAPHPDQRRRHAAHRLDARTYVLALSEDREMRQQWQRACELLLAEADVGALSKQIELALFYNGRLN
jgi:hypothetical protein